MNLPYTVLSIKINHLFKKNCIIVEILLYNFPVINLSIYVDVNVIIKKLRLEKKLFTLH